MSQVRNIRSVRADIDRRLSRSNSSSLYDLPPGNRTKLNMISDEGKGEQAVPKSKHTEAAISAALQQMDAGRKVADVAREAGVSTYRIYAWKAKYGGKRGVQRYRVCGLDSGSDGQPQVQPRTASASTGTTRSTNG